MSIRINKLAVRKVMSQPDWILGILSVLFLGVQAGRGVLPLPLWVFAAFFGIQAVTIHILECVKSRIKLAIYRGRGFCSWASGSVLWAWAVLLTGGLFSPLLYLMLLLILHYLRNPRRQRYVVAVCLIILPFVYRGVAGVLFPDWTAPNFVASLESSIVLGVAILGVLLYGLLLAEHRALEVEFLSSIGTFWVGSMSEDSFYRSVLARAMRLYQAEWGVVAIQTSEKPGKRFRVRYRAGKEVDDPGEKEEVYLNEKHLEFIDKGKVSDPYYPRKIIRKELGRRDVLYSFNFALKRFQTEEVVAVFSVYTDKFWGPLLPAFLYYLDILLIAAQTAYEMRIYTTSYRKLLLAEDHMKFTRVLNETCKELLPKSAGKVSVNLSISANKRDVAGAIVPVSVKLEEGRERPRWVTAMAKIERPNMVLVYTIRNYLKDVASATILKQRMDREEAIKASDKGVVGLSNLEMPNEEFCGKIKDWDGDHKSYDRTFRECGFHLLWANRLMKTWFPRIVEEFKKEEEWFKKGKGTCEKERGDLCCHHLFNTEQQKVPCWHCPCLSLFRRYLLAEDKDRKDVASTLEVMPAHSPAGRMRIYRHFELAASLILNVFSHPGDPLEDKVSFIRETVIDRTLDVEVLAILTKIATTIEKYPGKMDASSEVGDKSYNEVVDEMFEIVIEGLGRSFQANHVMKMGFTESHVRIEADYICTCATRDDKGRDKLANKERWILKEAIEEDCIEDYFRKRDNLFEEKKVSRRPILSCVAKDLRTLLADVGDDDIAAELRSKDSPELFGWSSCDGWEDHRCIVVQVPNTSSVLLIFTDEPEDWERVAPGKNQKLLPRLMEMQLCQSVGNMLGLLLGAVENTIRRSKEGEMKATVATWRLAATAFAHRIGNTLSISRSCFNMIRDDSDATDEIRSEAEKGLEFEDRVFELANGFKKYGAKVPLKLKKMKLVDMIEVITTRFKQKKPDVEIMLIGEKAVLGEMWINVDLQTLKDTFLAMIKDSIRFHPDNQPKIKIEFSHRDGSGDGDVLVVYSDDGLGIAQDRKEMIFEPFYSTSEIGTGIGLTDVKNVIESHGGMMKENGVPGKGVRFEITLPII